MRRLPKFFQIKTWMLCGGIIAFSHSPELRAAKIDWSGGGFMLKSRTPTASSSITNVLGSFQLSHRIEVLENVEFSYGYSMSFTKIFSGDYGFGPDVGFVYFPLTPAAATNIREGTIHLLSYEKTRPFVMASFHARQFQSIEASYAGFSTGAGVEFWNYHPIGIRVWARQTLLRGPQKSTASETVLCGGFSWEY